MLVVCVVGGMGGVGKRRTRAERVDSGREERVWEEEEGEWESDRGEVLSCQRCVGESGDGEMWRRSGKTGEKKKRRRRLLHTLYSISTILHH